MRIMFITGRERGRGIVRGKESTTKNKNETGEDIDLQSRRRVSPYGEDSFICEVWTRLKDKKRDILK
jgi:hypothetical protein